MRSTEHPATIIRREDTHESRLHAYFGGKAPLEMRDALIDLLTEAESMNADLRAIGRGRPDGWPQPLALAHEALRSISIA